MHEKGGAYPDFEGNITRLASLLNQLGERYGTRMIWWSDDVITTDHRKWRLPPAKDSGKGFLELSKIIRRIFL